MISDDRWIADIKERLLKLDRYQYAIVLARSGKNLIQAELDKDGDVCIMFGYEEATHKSYIRMELEPYIIQELCSLMNSEG